VEGVIARRTCHQRLADRRDQTRNSIVAPK
jgi:hypothetical protein